MEHEEMDVMEWNDEEEPYEADADQEFGAAISEALDATHEEMEAKQAAADEAAQKRSEERKEKKNARSAKKKTPRNYEADRIAASARRRMERLQKENDAFAQRMGYEDFRQMQEASAETNLRDFGGAPNPMEREIAHRANQQRFEEELRELNERFPEAEAWSADDFFALENAQEMVKLAQAGVPLYRAYAAYAVDSIAQRRANAAKRAALNAQSKEHLRKLGGIGNAASGTIPQDVLEQYRLINPDATDAEILAHWNRRD